MTLTRWQWLVVGPLALVGLGIISLAVASALSGRFSYTSDGGGWGISDDLAIQHGVHLVDLSDEAKREVFSLIERALPRTKNLGQQDCQTRAASTGPDFVDALWIPDGSRETLMPPNPRDDRIWSVLVSLETTLRGTGPALARVAFVSRAEGTRWNTPINLGDPIPTPRPGQDDCTYVYEFPSEVASALLGAITEPAE